VETEQVNIHPHNMHDQNFLIRESRSVSINSPVFSIFIPTWNNLEYLKLCVDSVRKHSRFPHQIIIHINEGKDGTASWVQSQADLSYTFSDENIGVCYALNQCRTLATADYFLYLNDDMYVCPGWDQHLFSEIKTIGHDAFFLSATVIEPEQTGNACVIVRNYGEDPASFQEDLLLKQFEDPDKSDWQGATWPPNIVHKKIWDLIGGYSIEFSPGLYSDPDFSMKLWKAGLRLFKGIGASRVYHFGGKSTARMLRNRGYFMFISKWGMSARTFTKNFLRSGKPFDGALSAPVLSFSTKFKNWFKRLQASLESNR
jgi:glycosyltransferase involved in cell wall biosynthesis